jgi:uncharacterized membrane protein
MVALVALVGALFLLVAQEVVAYFLGASPVLAAPHNLLV